jgi:hypothetical protein
MKQYFALGALGALLGLVAACATTETPATAGGVTIKMESGCTLVMVGDVSKQGANAAPNSSTNTPTNTTDTKVIPPVIP